MSLGRGAGSAGFAPVPTVGGAFTVVTKRAGCHRSAVSSDRINYVRHLAGAHTSRRVGKTLQVPLRAPPPSCPETPERLLVSPASTWYRVHRTGTGPADPKYYPPNPFKGGRFDSLDPSIQHLYCASTECAAVYETLLRDRPFELDGSPRVVERVRALHLSLSELECIRPLTYIRLFDLDDLARIGQEDEWLLTCASDQYSATREWSAAIRSWFPDADGIAWCPRFGRPAVSLVTFVARPTPGVPAGPLAAAFVPVSTAELLVPPARAIVDDCLRRRRATLL